MLDSRLIYTIISVLLVMFSAMLHEVAHGWAALKLGDATAKEAGRLTLNPAAHLDPFGSVALPLLMGLAGLPVFAFAKPVPYNPRRLNQIPRDEVLVALAGPACNILQAVVGSLLLRLALALLPASLINAGSITGAGLDAMAAFWLVNVLYSYIYVNLSLAFFNLIPLPPLDGSKLLYLVLRGQGREIYHSIQLYSMPILLMLFYLLPMVMHVDLLGIYLNATAGPLFDLLVGF